MKSLTIGIVKEIKDNEGRVILTPNAVKEIKKTLPKCKILIESRAGLLSGFSDEQYEKSGAKISDSIWEKADLILKVKEPLKMEIEKTKRNQTIMCFFHLPPLREYIMSNVRAKNLHLIALERLGSKDKDPLEAMSTIAGIRAVDFVSQGLILVKGLLIKDAVVTVVGASGIAGSSAFVELAGRNPKKIFCVDKNPRFIPVYAPNTKIILHQKIDKKIIKESDAIILAAKAVDKKTGAPFAPKIIGLKESKYLKTGTVIVDISIDEGGNFIYSKPTPASEAPYITRYNNWVVYAVPNMPGAVPRSSTPRLSEAILLYVIKVAKGILNNKKYPPEIKKALITKNSKI